jgi:hypothetical protein
LRELEFYEQRMPYYDQRLIFYRIEYKTDGEGGEKKATPVEVGINADGLAALANTMKKDAFIDLLRLFHTGTTEKRKIVERIDLLTEYTGTHSKLPVDLSAVLGSTMAFLDDLITLLDSAVQQTRDKRDTDVSELLKGKDYVNEKDLKKA